MMSRGYSLTLANRMARGFAAIFAFVATIVMGRAAIAEPARPSLEVSTAEKTSAPANAGDSDPSIELAPIADAANGKTVHPIDLVSALRLADATNPQIAFVRERVQQALAQQQAARTLWLPAIRGGVTFSNHSGPLQDTAGKIIETNRNSLEAGSGAFAFGSGPPMLPGVAFDFQLSDALFQPLAARRAVQSRSAATQAALNDVLFEVARSFVEMERSYADVAIAIETVANTRELSRITDAYFKSGTGLESDADRVRAELDLRLNDLLRSQELVHVTSARLARPLRLNQNLLLRPVDGYLVPLELMARETPLPDLLSAASASRPELAEINGMIGESNARAQRERFAPLLPTISIGTSYGGFGGSGGGNPYAFSDRTDVQAIAYWQLRNLGLGDQAARRDRESQLRQAYLRRQVIADLIAQEVTESLAQLQFRARQIDNAKSGVEVAIASFQRNLERIRGAQGLPIEALQSVQALMQARREYARAVSDFNIAQFALQRATGNLVAIKDDAVETPPTASIKATAH